MKPATPAIMRRRCLILTLVSLALTASAQKYDASNSLLRKALVYYEKDSNGFFQKRENVSLKEISHGYSYGYDKKSHEIYFETDRANCIAIVNKDLHKLLKKSKSIPQLKPEELAAKATLVSQKLEERFRQLNIARQEHIADSIETIRRDSIRKAMEDSLRIVAERNKEASYRNSHWWFFIPTKKSHPYCDFCEKTIDTKDSVFCYGIRNDTLYWRELMEGRLIHFYDHIHAAKVPSSLKSDKDFQYHCRIYKDSLETAISILNNDFARVMNAKYYLDYLKELKKEAPNGLFTSWGWDKEYSSIEFNFSYLNTNKNSIKYIEVFFVVTNDVGDVRKTGSFKGTGPLEEWESASWSWDHSSYYVAGDASRMNISKVIITYMNGSKVTIPKNKLRFD